VVSYRLLTRMPAELDSFDRSGFVFPRRVNTFTSLSFFDAAPRYFVDGELEQVIPHARFIDVEQQEYLDEIAKAEIRDLYEKLSDGETEWQGIDYVGDGKYVLTSEFDARLIRQVMVSNGSHRRISSPNILRVEGVYETLEYTTVSGEKSVMEARLMRANDDRGRWVRSELVYPNGYDVDIRKREVLSAYGWLGYVGGSGGVLFEQNSLTMDDFSVSRFYSETGVETVVGWSRDCRHHFEYVISGGKQIYKTELYGSNGECVKHAEYDVFGSDGDDIESMIEATHVDDISEIIPFTQGIEFFNYHADDEQIRVVRDGNEGWGRRYQPQVFFNNTSPLSFTNEFNRGVQPELVGFEHGVVLAAVGAETVFVELDFDGDVVAMNTLPYGPRFN
jgi:hypothetical protein